MRSSLSLLEGSTPGTVVISNSDVYFWNDYWKIGINGSAPSVDRQDKTLAYQEGLQEAVRLLVQAGHQVILVQPLPRFEVAPYSWSPGECTGDDVVKGRCKVEMPVTLVDELQGDLRAGLERVAAEEGAYVLDLRHLVCPDATCSTASQDGFLYMDPWHISVATSEALIPDFTQAIQATK